MKQITTASKAYLNWSGGKDAALALYHARKNKALSVEALFTSVNAVHNRVSMHGVRRELLEAQASAIGLPLFTAELPEQPSMQEYEKEMEQRVAHLKATGFDTAIFGDIFLEDLRRYREGQLAAHHIQCHFPLWQKDTRLLAEEVIALGIKAVVVCVNGAWLDKSFCGRLLDASFLADLPPGVDPCGERGEYHSFVFDGPIFNQPVAWHKGEIVARSYPAPDTGDACFGAAAPDYTFYFCDLLPSDGC